MAEKLSIARRIGYLIVALILFCWGCAFLVFFWLIITVPLGLAVLYYAFLFVSLAIQGRPYSDWSAEKDARKAVEREKYDALIEEKMVKM